MSPAGAGGPGRSLDPALADRIERLPGVEEVDRFRAFEVRYGGRPATLAFFDAGVRAAEGGLVFLSGRPARVGPAGPRRARRGHRQRAVRQQAGRARRRRHLSLPLGGRRVSFRVADIYYDYSGERGFMMADRSRLLALPARRIRARHAGGLPRARRASRRRFGPPSPRCGRRQPRRRRVERGDPADRADDLRQDLRHHLRARGRVDLRRGDGHRRRAARARHRSAPRIGPAALPRRVEAAGPAADPVRGRPARPAGQRRRALRSASRSRCCSSSSSTSSRSAGRSSFTGRSASSSARCRSSTPRPSLPASIRRMPPRA